MVLFCFSNFVTLVISLKRKEIVVTKHKFKILTYSVPILALLVVIIQFILVQTTNLSPWKGGGFGMYTGIHYYYNDLVISNLNKPFDSIVKHDRQVAKFVMDVKRTPNNATFKHIAELVSKYATKDTITVQLWQPTVDTKNSTYSRTLVKQYQFIKP